LTNFPGGPVVKNLFVNAKDMGLIPGLGRFYMPRVPQLLSLHSRAHEPLWMPESPRACARAVREAAAMRSPLATIRDSPLAATKIQYSQK